VVLKTTPALPLCLAVAIGEIAVWFIPQGSWPHLIGLSGGLTLLIRVRSLQSLLLGGLLGICAVVVTDGGRSALSTSNDVIFEGVVASVPHRRRPGEVTFLFRTNAESGKHLLRCRAVDLPWRAIYPVKRGDGLIVRGSVVSITKPRNPFSWKGWLWRQGVVGEMRVRFSSIQYSAKQSTLSALREGVRRHMYQKVGDTRGVNLFLSMALGHQDNLSPTIEKSFKRLGLTHLLVVSGYQVTLLYSVIVTMLAKMASLRPRSRSIRIPVGIAGLFCAFFYVLYIGSEFSGIRALLAAVSAGLGWMYCRPTGFLQRCSSALLIMLIVWPLCIFDIGVILTFAALLGIRIGSARDSSQPLVTFLSVNWCVWLTTTIVIVGWQGTMSLFGLLVNIVIAGPWSIMNCTVGVIGLFVSLVPVPGSGAMLTFIAHCNQWASDVVLWLSESFYSQIVVRGWIRGFILLGLVALIGRKCRIAFKRSCLLHDA
jgi:ComEC/Rec2-related protein